MIPTTFPEVLDSTMVERLPWSGCIVWLGSVSSEGYPRYGRKGEPMHKRALEFKLGRRLYYTITRHTCDIRCCINPDHVVEGSYADNTADMVRRGRAPHSLPLETVRAIRQEYTGKRGEQARLAAKYKVSITTIHAIVNGLTYVEVV